MARVLGGTSEPSQPEGDEPEVAVQVIVPQELAGFSMGELHSRRGQITGMDVLSDGVLIQASLPASEFHALEKAIAAGTQQRGRVKRAGQ